MSSKKTFLSLFVLPRCRSAPRLLQHSSAGRKFENIRSAMDTRRSMRAEALRNSNFYVNMS